MTNKERNLIKKKIVKCLTEDFKNNQAIFDKKEGWQVFNGTNLDMVMDKVVKGLEMAKHEFEDLADDLMKLFSDVPTDECIEKWWSEGNDIKYPDWWEWAPYRTNGDVIEEIKTAVKYFNKTNKS